MSESYTNPRALSAARYEAASPRYFWNTPTAAGAASFSMDSTRPRPSRSFTAKLRVWGHRILSARVF